MSKSSITKYLASIGSKGGAAGTGESKRRTRAHYIRAALLSHVARRRNSEKRASVPATL